MISVIYANLLSLKDFSQTWWMWSATGPDKSSGHFKVIGGHGGGHFGFFTNFFYRRFTHFRTWRSLRSFWDQLSFSPHGTLPGGHFGFSLRNASWSDFNNTWRMRSAIGPDKSSGHFKVRCPDGSHFGFSRFFFIADSRISERGNRFGTNFHFCPMGPFTAAILDFFTKRKFVGFQQNLVDVVCNGSWQKDQIILRSSEVMIAAILDFLL